MGQKCIKGSDTTWITFKCNFVNIKRSNNIDMDFTDGEKENSEDSGCCLTSWLCRKRERESGNCKARFYISNAPHTPFSTAVLNVDDFNTEMFFNIFERHMQSNAQEIINNGWHTIVSLYIFPNLYVPRQNKKKQKQKCGLYKKFGKNNAESGSGKKK